MPPIRRGRGEAVLGLLAVLVELAVELVDFVAQPFEPFLDADDARIKMTDVRIEIADVVLQRGELVAHLGKAVRHHAGELVDGDLFGGFVLHAFSIPTD